jgi:predicted dehydrogenase
MEQVHPNRTATTILEIKMSLRIAFAGTGFNKIHAAAARIAGAQLVAVVNHRPDSMAKFAAEFNIPRQYEHLDELLEQGGVDALVVATPNYLHAEQTIAALNAGLHVMVEKPMAMNAAEAEAMYRAAQKAGKNLMVAHCFRFDQETIWLRELIASGRIGKIIRTKGCGVHVYWGPTGWFAQKKFAGGGAMADMGVHALDTARFLLGDPQPVSVYARISTNYGDYDVDDTAMIVVNWDNGASSYFESGWWQPHADQPNAGTQLYGQNGFASLFPTRIESPNTSRDSLHVLNCSFAEKPQDEPGNSKYDTQMEYFIRCIQKKINPVPGGLEGWTNMRIVDAAYESSSTGKVVDLK